MCGLTFGQNGHFNKKNQPKEPCVFMPHIISPNEHFFGQCEHFSQVEPFEKP
jgi:hypothetical protein